MQIRNSQTVRNLGCVKAIKLGVQWPILNHHPSAHAEPSDEAQGIVHRRSSVRNLCQLSLSRSHVALKENQELAFLNSNNLRKFAGHKVVTKKEDSIEYT